MTHDAPLRMTGGGTSIKAPLETQSRPVRIVSSTDVADAGRLGPHHDRFESSYEMTTPAARSWPPAGSWIRRHFWDGGWATARWHLFTGDAIWRFDWPGPSLETACGYRTGSLSPLESLTIAEAEPTDPCGLCLRKQSGGRPDPAS